MLVSLAAPVVANWLRAYMIVMLGHVSGNHLAVGADHLVYGWVFFGIIIMVMFMIGARWSEPDPPALAFADRPTSLHGGVDARTWTVAAGVVALLVATQALVWKLDLATPAQVPVVKLPPALEGGWTARPADPAAWAPIFKNPSATAHVDYVSGDKVVTVWVGYFRNQGQERKLVSTTNILVEDHSPVWALVSAGSSALSPAAPAARVSTAVLRQPADLKVEPRVRLQVAHLYWVDGHFTHRAAEAKVRTALSRLMGRGDDGAVLTFTTSLPADGPAAVDLHRFISQQLPVFGPALTRTAAAARP